jgi:hypothetical protein
MRQDAGKNTISVANHARLHVETTWYRVSRVAKEAILCTRCMILYQLFMQEVFLD